MSGKLYNDIVNREMPIKVTVRWPFMSARMSTIRDKHMRSWSLHSLLVGVWDTELLWETNWQVFIHLNMDYLMTCSSTLWNTYKRKKNIHSHIKIHGYSNCPPPVVRQYKNGWMKYSGSYTKNIIFSRNMEFMRLSILITVFFSSLLLFSFCFHEVFCNCFTVLRY